MSSLFKLIIFTLLIVALLIAVPNILGSKTYQFDNLKSSNLDVVAYKPPPKNNLALYMNKYLAANPVITDKSAGTFAIYVEDLNNGNKFSYNDSEVIESASLYKLIVFAGIMDQINKGNLTFDTVISDTIDHLASVYGEVDYGYDNSGTVTYTVEQALERVAEVSDNFAAIMLTDQIYQLTPTSQDPMQDLAKQLGMNNTDFSTEYITTTASDIDLYFEQLYNGQIVSKTYSDKIIDLLETNQLNDRIPALLPDDIKIAHKDGELDGVRNDAGIVYPANGENYIIVMMSKDLTDVNNGVDIEAKISKAVYDYFSAIPGPSLTPTTTISPTPGS